MTTLPHNASVLDLLRWVANHANQPFDPNMVIQSTHTSDWQWQAVLGQMEDLRRQNYILKLKQDPWGSTYWGITTTGLNYLRALESFSEQSAESQPQSLPEPALATQTPAPLAPTNEFSVATMPSRKRYFWPFVERMTLRFRGLVSWEEMPTHLASHLIYDVAKLAVSGSLFGLAMLYVIHLLHRILASLPSPTK